MPRLNNIETSLECNLLVSFFDLSWFSIFSQNKPIRYIFDFLAEYYEFVGDIIEQSGGRVVKFIGDGALVVFPEENLDSGVQALMTLREEGDKWLEERESPCRHMIKAHFGPVICGPVGSKSEKRFDVFGHTVNLTFIMKSSGLAITPQVFRQLDPDTRKLFKKHTPPITYIPVGDSHKT